MRKEKFENENFYHIYNRGVDKRTIFSNERDYVRFVAALYLFNDSETRDYDLTAINLLNLRGLASYTMRDRKPMIDIIHWCLMPNHFHLLLRQGVENGITNFMQKVGTSYTMYFNRKYQRSGRLFEGTFKAKPVECDEYFSHLSTYIPLNPVSLYSPGWKENGVPAKDIHNIKEKLLQYRWSSLADYFVETSIPKFVIKESFFEVFGGSIKQYEELIDEYLLRGLPPSYKDQLLIYEA